MDGLRSLGVWARISAFLDTITFGRVFREFIRPVFLWWIVLHSFSLMLIIPLYCSILAKYPICDMPYMQITKSLLDELQV